MPYIVRTVLFSVLFALALTGCPCGGTAAAHGGLTVRVSDSSSGAPITSATVHVTRSDGTVLTGQPVAGPTADYYVQGTSDGEAVTISATAPDFENLTETATPMPVACSTSSLVEVHLIPAS